MSDSEDSDTEFPFERIEPDLPVCIGVDPAFCKLAFNIKQTLYNDIMYQGNPDTEEAQDMQLNTAYESTIGSLFVLFNNLLRTKGQQNTGVPQEINQKLPPNVQDKITQFYNMCYEQTNNADRKELEMYKRLINNLFHTYIYDMGSR
jgi:hypothetical protein